MGVSKNRVGPQNGWFISWKTYLLMDDLGGFSHPYFWKHPYTNGQSIGLVYIIMGT